MFDKKLSRRRFAANSVKFAAACMAAVATPLRALAKPGVSEDAVAGFRSGFAGEVISRSHPYFDTWCHGMSWQLRETPRRPELIAQPKSVADVVSAVRFAGEQGMKVGIRSGGHSWVYSSIRDDGMLLDLRNFRDIQVNSQAMTATVGPAVTARELATTLEKAGLGFPVAHCSTVALGGYLLGGGQAWNWGSWGGAACNSVEALDVVDARGEIIRVDAENHADLLWAARGSGPGFPAVVTHYHLKLYHLPRAIHMNSYTWPLEDTLAVSRWLPELGAALSDKVEPYMFLLTLPKPIDGVSKVVMVTGVAFAETPEEAGQLLAPMSRAKSLSSPIAVEEMKPMTMNGLLDLVDRIYPPCRAAVDTFWFDLSMEEVMQRYASHFAAAPSPLSNVLCEVKPKPIVIPDTAYSMRRLTYLSPYSLWLHEKDDAENIAWMRKTQEILAPLSVGHYINEADLEVSPERSERSYSEASWERIRAIKQRYDPGGLFHTYLGH